MKKLPAIFCAAALAGAFLSGCGSKPVSTNGTIQLAESDVIGKAEFAVDAQGLPDTTAGGHGQKIDGIPCGPESPKFHWHVHLALFVNGEQIQIPAGVGIVRLSNDGGCFYWVHTHDPTGIVHIESPQRTIPGGVPFTLGTFFDFWGLPVGPNQVGSFAGPVAAYVDGTRYRADFRSIVLHEGRNITLEIGAPPVVPPKYLLPAKY